MSHLVISHLGIHVFLMFHFFDDMHKGDTPRAGYLAALSYILISSVLCSLYQGCFLAYILKHYSQQVDLGLL